MKADYSGLRVIWTIGDCADYQFGNTAQDLDTRRSELYPQAAGKMWKMLIFDKFTDALVARFYERTMGRWVIFTNALAKVLWGVLTMSVLYAVRNKSLFHRSDYTGPFQTWQEAADCDEKYLASGGEVITLQMPSHNSKPVPHNKRIKTKNRVLGNPGDDDLGI